MLTRILPNIIGLACLFLSGCAQNSFVDCGDLDDQLEEIFNAGSTSKDVWARQLAPLRDIDANRQTIDEFLGDWEPGDRTKILSTECYGTETGAVSIRARFLTPRLGEGFISATIRRGPLQAYSFYLLKDVFSES